MRPLLFTAGFCVYLTVAFGQSEPREQFAQYRKDVEANPSSSLAHYRLAELLFLEKNLQAAANEFREALNGDSQPPWTVTWSHISLARIFDQTGQHERAANEYRLAQMEIETPDGMNQSARPGVYRLGPGVTSPELIEKTDAEYSEEARAAGLEGTVWISAVITENGAVQTPRLSRPLGLGLDEKAAEAVQRWRFRPATFQGAPVAVLMNIPIDFRLPARPSRWHLVGVAFRPPPGASRPSVLRTKYPLGPGIAPIAIEEGWLVAAMGRLATASIAFEIDERGTPGNFQVMAASDPIWGNEAIAMLMAWRFEPGVKDGAPVSVPCTMDLAWGEKSLRKTPLSAPPQH